jgi:hypothetical protein
LFTNKTPKEEFLKETHPFSTQPPTKQKIPPPVDGGEEFLDRTEAKRRTTAAGSPMGERSESINKIFEIKGIDRRGEGLLRQN